MLRMGLRKANQQFALVMREVRAGRDVMLTDRGVPLAVISRLPQAEDEVATLTRLEREGFLRRPTRPGPMPSLKLKPLPRRKGKSVSDTIIEDREERI